MIHRFASFAAERKNIEKARPDHQAPTEAPVQSRDRIPQTSKSNIVYEKPKKQKTVHFLRSRETKSGVGAQTLPRKAVQVLQGQEDLGVLQNLLLTNADRPDSAGIYSINSRTLRTAGWAAG